MNIGVLKENSALDRRVALSPAGVQALVASGTTVYVQRHAGSQTLFTDEEYRDAGANISYNAEEVLNRCEITLKVSPPTSDELAVLEEGQALFSFHHLAVSQRKTIEALLERKVTAIAYELIENEQGDLAVLLIMSEIAGQLSIQVAAHYLQAREGGRGILLGNIPGLTPTSVAILGAGTAGRTAARVAVGLGAEVTVLDKDLRRLRELHTALPVKIHTAIATSYNISRVIKYADVVIGAVLLKGEKTPHLVSEEMVKQMKVGSVIVDLSIDQGGCVETSRPTTLNDPIFIRHGVVHYCVPNMTAAIPRTATSGLTNALLPYLQNIGERGLEGALRMDAGLARGVCTYGGYCTNPAIARAFSLKPKDMNVLLGD
ncbi:MAG: alanine dehydrogenase [Ignavibacteria bacterium]|nr:alanine dehydrogenase [Ignavibacteria bacterium]